MNVRLFCRIVRDVAVCLLGVAALVVVSGGVGKAAGTVYINPGDDIQAQVNANSSYTTFVLRGGVHRMQTIRPKEGDVFQGEPGAILSGARPLTTFTRSGSGGGGSSTSYLSDRNWSFMTSGWGPVERDRSNAESSGGDGRTITLSGQTFAKGLGVHAPSDVRFALGGACSTFSATVGLDDEVGGNGDVAFQVWADGVRIWDSGMMMGNSPNQSFTVGVSGKNELRLVVWESANAYYDHADWADARLNCSGGGGSGSWVASGQTQQGEVKGMCQSGYPRCGYPEQLFIDDTALQHVGSVGEVGPGKFFFDYGADQIYFGDDPTGRRVEASVTATAFEPTADYVTISGLVVERFASVAQQGAINGAGRTGWVVANNNVRFNHGAAIRVGTGGQVRSNYASSNGQLGIIATGDNVLIENNDIYNNNTAKFWATWEAGGTKFVGTRNLVVRGNYVHSNGGPGLWSDVDNINTLYESNTCDNNERMGIFVEISYDTIIRYNTVRWNGFGLAEYIWGAGILNSASPNVEIYGNYLEGNADGIGAAQQARGSGPYGAHEIWNLYVHDNTIVNTVGWTGLVQDNGDNSLFQSRNNWFVRNSYSQSPDAYHYVWMNAERTPAEWASFGQN